MAIDAPPLNRAAGLIGLTDGGGSRFAVLRAPTGDGYFVVFADGTQFTLPDSRQLLDYLDKVSASEKNFSPVFEEADYFNLRRQLVHRTVATEAQVALTNGVIVPVRKVQGPQGPTLALEIRENLLLQAAGPNNIKDLNSVLRVSFDVPDTRVMSLFDETDNRIRHALDGAVGEAHFDMAGVSPDQILGRLAEFDRKIVVVVGHIEDGDFVVRGADGDIVARVPVRDMERVAVQNGTSLILIGCDTARVAENSSGLTAPVNDIVVASSLRRAMRAQTYGGFLSALGTEAAPLLIRAGTLRGHRSFMRAERLSDAEDLDRLMRVNVSSIAVAGKSPAAAAERRSRLVPFIPVWMQYLYVAGIAVAVMLSRTLWREWNSAIPILDTRSAGLTGVKRAVRGAGYVVLSPVVGALLLAAMPVAVLLLFLPLVPWSLPGRLLYWLEVLPFRAIGFVRTVIWFPEDLVHK